MYMLYISPHRIVIRIILIKYLLFLQNDIDVMSDEGIQIENVDLSYAVLSLSDYKTRNNRYL